MGALVILPFISLSLNRYSKEDDGTYFESWRIKVNKKRDSHRTNNIKISGTCCWKIRSRSGETEVFSPAEDKQPTLAYIERISTQKCSKRKRRCTQD